MSDRMTWKEAVCYDPAHFALAGIRDGQVRLGDRVAVFGLGAIGQMTVQMAKMAGASFVAAVDPIAKRRAVVENIGIDLALDPTTVDVGEELKKATGGLGIDVAIETSANYQALDGAIRGLAYGGNVAVVGWMKECKGGLDLGAVAHFDIPNLIFARACSDPIATIHDGILGALQITAGSGFPKDGLIVRRSFPRWCRSPNRPQAYEEMDLHPETSVKLGVAFE